MWQYFVYLFTMSAVLCIAWLRDNCKHKMVDFWDVQMFGCC